MRSVVFVSTMVGYFFYIETGTGAFVYSKTTDGGATWGAAVTVKSAATQCAYDVWFDQWTPGDSGTKIHLTYFDVTNDDVFYRSLDTASDTLGTERTVFNGATAIAGRGNFSSITKTRSGLLYVAYDIDAGTEKGFHRSTDGGTTWSASLSSTFIEATIDQCKLFPASGTGDDDDCWALYQDASADALTLKLWDSSAAAAVESATLTALGENTTDLTGQYWFDGAVRHSDGHLIVVAKTAAFGAPGNTVVSDVTSTSTFTTKTNVSTGTDDHAWPQIFIDQTTNDLYVAYNGKRDGSEGLGGSSKVWYSKSTDGGASWGAEQPYMEGAVANVVQVWCPKSGPLFYCGWRVGSTLVGNAVNSVAFSSGTTFNDSVTESVTASESESATAAFAGSRTESGTAADTETVTAQFVSARSDSLAAADSETGGQALSASRSDTLAVTDSEVGGVGFAVARGESVTAGESSTGQASYPVARTEVLAASDSEDATTSTGPVVYNVSAGDSLSASDSEVCYATYPVARAESGSASDSLSSSAFFAGLLAEQLATGESLGATASMFVDRADLLALSESATGDFAPTGATYTFEIQGGPVVTLSIIAGPVLSSLIEGGPVLTGSMSGGPV